MARKSRRLQNTIEKNMEKAAPAIRTEPAAKQKAMLRTAAYGRLSVENSGGETDESLQTQMVLLYQFITNHPELTLEDSYVDNGYSGTHFQRPEFVRLMEDVRSGRIQCIVVKDLSRFGRNYLETGYYIETLFPHLNVRFIAVTDEFDSIREEDRNSLSVPIKNMVNAMYAKDISQKMCAASEIRLRRPDTMPMGTAPFGYQFSEDKKQFLAKEETADIVRVIFAWAKLGISAKNIAKRLELIGAVTPGNGRSRQNGNTRETASWTADAVYKILKNPNYTGNIHNGRIRQALYKSEKTHRTAPEEWFVRENTHEPLVTKEDYAQIQAHIRKNSAADRLAKENHKQEREELRDYFPGMVYCAECGCAMHFSRLTHDSLGRKMETSCYICRPDHGKAPCGGRKIYEDYLKIVVMDQIYILLKSMCSRKKLLDIVNTSQGGRNALLSVQKKMLALQVKITEAEKKHMQLLRNADNKAADSGNPPEATGWDDREMQRMQEELAGLAEKLKRLKAAENQYAGVVKHMEAYLDDRTFNAGLVKTLVDRITFSNDGSIAISFQCKDVYQELAEAMERSKQA